jgi:hypothetical protein
MAYGKHFGQKDRMGTRKRTSERIERMAREATVLVEGRGQKAGGRISKKRLLRADWAVA